MMKTYICVLSVVGLSATFFGQAIAQTATSNQAPPATAGGNQSMDEIVVTAQRRSESLQDVPMSITALTGAQLESAGAITTQDLQLVTPGLNWSRGTSVSQPNIRGIGTTDAAAGDEANVATYIDGVYQPWESTTLMQLSNVERVEVLKGPQGTLYGRNATGGAINIITARPSLDDWTGNAELTGGRFDYQKETGYLSGPLIKDELAFGLAATNFKDDGYVNDVYLNRTIGGDEGTNVRAKLLFKPTDGVEFQLNGLYVWSIESSPLTGQALNGNTSVKNFTPIQNPNNLPLDILVPTAKWTTSMAVIPSFKLNQSMVDAHMSIDLGWATLTGLASYESTFGTFNSQSDWSPLELGITYFAERGRAQNQELVLTSNGASRLTWLVGGQTFEGSDYYSPVNTSTLLPSGFHFPYDFYYGQATTAYAAFAEATYQIVDALYLTGGVRYNHDKKTSANETPPGSPLISDSTDFNNTSPRAVLRYEFSPKSSAYFSYTQGFKSGTYNAVTPLGAETPAKPETVKAYEIGLKTTPTPGVTINAAVYHYDYTDLQEQIIENVPGTAANETITLNAPQAKIDGVELDGDFRPMRNLGLGVGMNWMNPRITNFNNASVLLPRTATAPGGTPGTTSSGTTCAAGVAPLCGNYAVPFGVSIDGDQLIRAAKFTVNLDANYKVPLPFGALAFDVNGFYSTKYYLDLNNTVSQGAYKVVNASVSFISPDEHWTVKFFGENLTDEYYVMSFLQTASTNNAAYNKPRWFGGSIAYRF
jgi:iron complex outermembrane recepter protein